MVELGIVEAASYTTIYRVLKENELKPHKNKYWVIPPEKDADFVAAMEDTLEVYTRPRDPARPVICLDETSKQLTRETRTPLPRGPGRVERIDYEYERAGVANVFMLFVPLKRYVSVRERRTAMPMSCANRRASFEKPIAFGSHFSALNSSRHINTK